MGISQVRDAAELLTPAVAEAIAALDATPEDAAVVKLAQQYARVIDSQTGHCHDCQDPDCHRSSGSAWAMRWLAPLLLDALEQLGATPAARARLKKGAPPDAGENQLSRLRKARTGQRRA